MESTNQTNPINSINPINTPKTHRYIRILLPSIGDMHLVRQEGGSLLLDPIFFGGECYGPILQVVDIPGEGGTNPESDPLARETLAAAYRVRIRPSGEAKLVKADIPGSKMEGGEQ